MESEGNNNLPSLTWDNIHVATKPTRKKKEVLRIVKGVSGRVNPGECVAILGPSGCGKTTLLDVLARGDSQPTTTRTGSALYDGRHVSQHRGFISYVQQADALMGVFSARELLMFSARLRLRGATNAERRERVENVLQQLRLGKVADSKVGDDKVKGLSGGERRRVSIGVELVTSPKVLIIDEPTSGLDSHIAKAVMDTIVDITTSEKLCVLFTIHQPSSHMTQKFHKLILMAEGQFVFSGSVMEGVRYFTEISPQLQCPEFTNPAEHFLDIITGGIEATIEAEKGTQRGSEVVGALISIWRESQLESQTDVASPLSSRRRSALAVPNSTVYAVSWPARFVTVLDREWKNFIRDPYYMPTQLMTNFVTAIFSGLMYWDISDPRTLASSHFFLIINAVFVPFMSVMIRFPLARQVFNREKQIGYYDTLSFFFAYFVVDIPMQILMTLIFALPCYWMIGYTSTIEHFSLFCVWLYFTFQTGQSAALAITAMFPTVTGALAAGSVFLIILLSFGGFFLDLSSIPVWFDWISHVSLFRYVFEGMVVSELRDREGGPEFIASVGMKDQLWYDALILTAMVFVFRLVALISLMFFKGNTNL